jgi:hypothetical protein
MNLSATLAVNITADQRIYAVDTCAKVSYLVAGAALPL